MKAEIRDFNDSAKDLDHLRAKHDQGIESMENEIESLKNLPGIGAKSAKAFYDAGYKTTKSIISAKDEDLLAIPGVGINLVKKLKKLK